MHVRCLTLCFAGLFVASAGTVMFAGEARAAEPAAAIAAADDPTKVEFFEKLYQTKITGVKLLEDYDDPDGFYSAIAQQVGIPEIALDAVSKRFGWKRGDGCAYSAVVKGGWDAPNWGVMVSRLPMPKEKPKTAEEMRALMKRMELKFVVIGYDGTITFPQEDKKAEQTNGDGSEATTGTKKDRPGS
jgi:hypothetical protein